jgi:hypothetical protein
LLAELRNPFIIHFVRVERIGCRRYDPGEIAVGRCATRYVLRRNAVGFTIGPADKQSVPSLTVLDLHPNIALPLARRTVSSKNRAYLENALCVHLA